MLQTRWQSSKAALPQAPKQASSSIQPMQISSCLLSRGSDAADDIFHLRHNVKSVCGTHSKASSQMSPDNMQRRSRLYTYKRWSCAALCRAIKFLVMVEKKGVSKMLLSKWTWWWIHPLSFDVLVLVRSTSHIRHDSSVLLGSSRRSHSLIRWGRKSGLRVRMRGSHIILSVIWHVWLHVATWRWSYWRWSCDLAWRMP